uniref:Piscidin-4 n=1 Tax=Amphiprion ocellaris TaxID=80972 RepID=A0A3Q1CLK6_AMPOC
MKCTVVFLVLSMVVLMVEPGECIWRALFHGTKKDLEDQQLEKQLEQLEQLDKLDYNPRRPALD